LLVEESLQANIVELVLEILQRAPGVKLLVTSRQVLNLQGNGSSKSGDWHFQKSSRQRDLESMLLLRYSFSAPGAPRRSSSSMRQTWQRSPTFAVWWRDAAGNRAGWDLVEDIIACGNR